MSTVTRTQEQQHRKPNSRNTGRQGIGNLTVLTAFCTPVCCRILFILLIKRSFNGTTFQGRLELQKSRFFVIEGLLRNAFYMGDTGNLEKYLPQNLQIPN
jgi:hypothetical protein